jgi:hypothetical protein
MLRASCVLLSAKAMAGGGTPTRVGVGGTGVAVGTAVAVGGGVAVGVGVAAGRMPPQPTANTAEKHRARKRERKIMKKSL